MNVKKIYIGELPPEVGPPGERLIILFENGIYESILIEGNISAYVLSNELTMLAERIGNLLKNS